MPLTLTALSKVDDKNAGLASSLVNTGRMAGERKEDLLRGWTKRWGTRGWWRSARALTTTGSSSSSATGSSATWPSDIISCLSPGVGLRRVASQRLGTRGVGGLGQVMAQDLTSR
jgi:hypothetical protein